MELNLKNKNALVCGSTQGIGKATAHALASEGVNVTLVARNEDKLKEVLTELPNTENHSYIVADFSNPEDLKNKVSAFIENNHGFHILVNNTGGPKSGNILDASISELETAFTQHIKCNHLLAQTLIPFMKTEGYGRIINIVSLSGLKGMPGQVNYSAAKAGIIGATKALAQELAKRNITVNAIAPGFIQTDMTADLNEQELKALIPMNRFGQPDEVAELAGFLASRAAGYITGQVISINGGLYS